MSSPFDREDGEFLVLVNAERQYSLWPNDIDVPASWTIQHGPSNRTDCMDFIETHWADMRPASLVAAMEDAY
ncbi:MbtH family protein [Streptomyces nojiriensis]|uniref:MbtH family protein n=1 Tax=Streptomyces nojiriensis TaxID=66374 RepID=UPI002E190E39